MHLDDKTIGHIAKLIQLAIITGTDIVDHLRMMKLELSEENSLVLDKEYNEIHDTSLQTMIQNAQTTPEESST